MKRNFTWFAKLTDIVNEVSKDMPEAVGELVCAITNYGTYGIEPEFDNLAVKYAFMAVREDIDNSVAARENGRKGGRPRSNEADTGQVEEENTRSKPMQNLSVTYAEPLDNLSVTPGEPIDNLSVTTPEPPYTVNHTKPNQVIPIHTKPKGGGARFRAPTPSEVDSYCLKRELAVDAVRFCDYYTAQGWRLSNGNPMKDWKAAVRNWARTSKPDAKEVDGEYGQYAKRL